ncbi:pleckstrin homology domain-containing family O member 2 [Osmerus eperlanus]|uniref:pleckstrin homology domain-containing family O member 2 n=1 Tax=Osmerus eperlanus TaxID=29151 RepID=UPI002E1191E1
MEDSVKESPAKPKEAQLLGKAGWVKKASGRFLVSYKDRYVQVERTQVLMYEKEDLQNCLEKVDLANYDKCHEMKSAFKKKNRLVLIRSPKSVNKVNDVKFQAANLEEKEAWIKALSDGINRAKNKVFDEVKIDESSNLDHVTRTRPKGNRNRRPPTRIHMKEVANVSSEGMLRLDLDITDSSTPNGTLYVNVETTDSPKEVVKPLLEALEEEEPQEVPQTEEPSPQKKVLKPPMPPSKEAKLPAAAESEDPDNTSSEEKVVLKPPMPPSKESKPAVSAEGKVSQEDFPDDDLEKSPEAGVETGQPATPPNKPHCSSTDNLAVSPQSSQNPKPPTPPSKDKKPTQPISTSETTHLESEGVKDEGQEEEQDKSETTSSDIKQTILTESVTKVESSTSSPKEVPTSSEVRDEPLVTSTEEETPQHAPEENVSAPCSEVPIDPEEEPKVSQLKAATPSMSTPEPIKKSPCPPTPFKKKPIKIPPPKTQVEPCDPQPPGEAKKITILPDKEPNPPPTISTPDHTVSKPDKPERDLKLPVDPKTEVPVVVLCLADPGPDSPSSSPAPCHRSLEKRECEEEKSVDSGQHSDDDGEGSEAGDTTVCSTASLRGSQAALDMIHVSEDDNEPPDSLGQSMDTDPPMTNTARAPAGPQVSSTKVHSTFLNVRINQSSRPPVPLKPSARSASLGDLLSESSGSDTTRDLHPHVMDLESEVDLKLKNTGDLLATLTSQQSPTGGQSSAVLVGDGLEKGSPEELLARAMEKLRKAEMFLQEAKNMKESNHSENNSKRNSW